MWNLNDMIRLTLCPLIVICSIPNDPLISLETLRILAAIATFSMILKMYDWMRLFEATSFYILLIEVTIKDISGFLMLLCLALTMFGVPMIMLDLNRSNKVVEEEFSFWLSNLLIN